MPEISGGHHQPPERHFCATSAPGHRPEWAVFVNKTLICARPSCIINAMYLFCAASRVAISRSGAEARKKNIFRAYDYDAVIWTRSCRKACSNSHCAERFRVSYPVTLKRLPHHRPHSVRRPLALRFDGRSGGEYYVLRTVDRDTCTCEYLISSVDDCKTSKPFEHVGLRASARMALVRLAVESRRKGNKLSFK